MDCTQSRSDTGIDLENRLCHGDTFRFECGPHVSCFTECCRKLELLLTPYDVLRLRKRLDLSSSEFLEDHCIIRWRTAHGFPEVLLQMDSGDDRLCPFVTPAGCSVYDDRPAACRIYPLGRASTTHRGDGAHQEFYFTVREEHCRGFEEATEWTVREWLADQGVKEYNRLNDLLMELYVRRARVRSVELTERHIQMFVMACYNTEKFREFIFGSPFLTRFDVDEELVEGFRKDDVRLLEFAFRWLKFALFAEPAIKVRSPLQPDGTGIRGSQV